MSLDGLYQNCYRGFRRRIFHSAILFCFFRFVPNFLGSHTYDFAGLGIDGHFSNVIGARRGDVERLDEFLPL